MSGYKVSSGAPCVHGRPGLVLHAVEEMVTSTAVYDHKLTSIQK